MFLNKPYIIAGAGLLLLFGIGIAQFTGFEDAPTRRGSTSVRSGTLEGLYVEKKVGETPDAKDVTITFILSKLPSAFFDYYDTEKKAIMLDLYDTRVGESQLDSILESPIIGSRVEDTQIDLNKDISGLKPDYRDVVRVIMNCNYNIIYEIEEEFGTLNLTFKWNKKIEKQLKRSKKAIFWRVPLAMGIVGGLGYASYMVWFQRDEPPEKETIKDLVNSPPIRPVD